VPIGRVDQLAFDGLAEGEHLLRLSGVARNCILAEENPQGVVVSSGDSARVNFTINCWPSPTGRIAFIRDGDIYTVRGDGTGLVNLSLEYANLGFPLESAEHLSWSPDGQRLAVSLVIGGIALIDGAMRFDTGPPEILEVEGGCVAWSPDGETLAFTNLLDELRTINLRTRAERTLFASSDTLSMMGCPAWSPDGARIAFPGARRNPTFVGDVVVLDAGGGPTSSLFGGFPGRLVTEISWGLEESHFAVVADFAIFLVPLPSHSAVLLLRNEFDPAEPTWAPDGRWLAFEEANRIFVIHPDGSGKTQLTFASVFEGLDSGPVWGRDP
jgi:WD40 repeat protein